MSDHERERRCAEHADELAELALGVLTGRERARVLSHVASCPRCSAELEVLSRAADSVVLAAPEVEPPLGFEVRLFEGMGVADGVSSRRRFWHSRWVPVAAAAAAVLVALGAGLALTASPRTPSTSHTRSLPSRTSAPLTEDGRTVGHVTIDAGRPWMSMTLDDSSAHGVVQCVVVTDDGVVHHVGTFVARAGYGAWIAPLHVNPTHVRSAEVVSTEGAVIAAATLS